MSKKICIVGAGLVGSLMAIFLAEAGFNVDVYEKRKDPTKDTKTRGRSIGLSLSDRGWKALRQAGLEKEIKAHTQPAYARVVHEEDGTTVTQFYGDGSQAIYTVNRNYLNATLIKKAASTGRVSFFFEQGKGNLSDLKDYDHVIAADGVFSELRSALFDEGAFETSLLSFGYKELCIPSKPGEAHALNKERIHVWPRKNSFLIAFPTIEGEFVSTLFLPAAGPDSLEAITTKKQLMDFFGREYKEVIDLVPNLEKEFFHNPFSTITEVQGGPWNFQDRALFLGDAVHAITPFYGMGMNIGFEDCTVFMDHLEKNKFDFGKTFKEFTAIRKPDTDAMRELSFKNFKSLEESPDPLYQAKWSLERRIWKLFPNQWMPAYPLITLSEVPLRVVPEIKDRQDRIIDELVRDMPGIGEIGDKELKDVVLGKMKEYLPATKLYDIQKI